MSSCPLCFEDLVGMEWLLAEDVYSCVNWWCKGSQHGIKYLKFEWIPIHTYNVTKLLLFLETVTDTEHDITYIFSSGDTALTSGITVKGV